MSDAEQSSRAEVEANTGVVTLVVPPAGDGLRLDQCLTTLLRDHSRAYYQKLIRNGDVLLRGRTSRRAETVQAGDEIRIRHPQTRAQGLEAEPIDFGILYEDDDLLVINKPPGLVVHPADGTPTGTLVHGLLFHDEDSFADMTDDTLRPGIVHRLDKDTSGVMVVARNLESRHLLKAAFKERAVEKTYLALVIGEFGTITGTIENQIGRHPVNRQKMAVVSEGGKHALTKYRVLGTAMGCSLLEVRIFTGRTHQIRVHFSHLHHPILGDGLYGGNRPGVPYQAPRQLLHAWKLAFPHPRTKVMREYMAPLPADFGAALAALGLPAIATQHDTALPIQPQDLPEVPEQ
jgi:23S rRNA pseudouridine1911/1915/1917 synthase